MELIIGLGNPKKEYNDTRHNAGFLILDILASTFEFPEWKFDKKSNAEIAKGEINKKRIVLAKPQTYMNNSGLAVRTLLDFYKLTIKDILVIQDDKDIPLGEIRIQTNRGPAGHNGIKSIIEHLGTQDFTRIRVGVAPAKQEDIRDTADFVLAKFTAEEKKVLSTVAEHITKKVEQIIG